MDAAASPAEPRPSSDELHTLPVSKSEPVVITSTVKHSITESENVKLDRIALPNSHTLPVYNVSSRKPGFPWPRGGDERGRRSKKGEIKSQKQSAGPPLWGAHGGETGAAA